MNREIKFRAWDTERRAWIDTNGTTFTGVDPTEGTVALTLDGHLRVFHSACYDANPELGINEPLHGTANSEYESVHPMHTEPHYNRQYVLEQFTGLLDKNRKEIYEGDILRWVHAADDSDHGTSSVVYSQQKAQFELDADGYYSLSSFGYMPDQSIEVIGNIHENPDLLK